LSLLFSKKERHVATRAAFFLPVRAGSYAATFIFFTGKSFFMIVR
jgi:hypothetical protein